MCAAVSLTSPRVRLRPWLSEDREPFDDRQRRLALIAPPTSRHDKRSGTASAHRASIGQAEGGYGVVWRSRRTRVAMPATDFTCA